MSSDEASLDGGSSNVDWGEIPPSAIDTPAYWCHVELSLGMLAMVTATKAFRLIKVSAQRACLGCQKSFGRGYVIHSTLREPDGSDIGDRVFFCSACVHSVEQIVALSNLTKAEAYPAFLDYRDQVTSDFFRALGVLWFAAMARRYGVRAETPLLRDLAAVALVKRFFKHINPDEQLFLVYWARAALTALRRCHCYRVDPSTIEYVHATSIDGPLLVCPRELRRAFFVEIDVDPNARLVDDNIFLGWYPFADQIGGGRIGLIGLEASGRAWRVSFVPDWSLTLDEFLHDVGEQLDGQESKVRAMHAVRFLLVLGLVPETMPLCIDTQIIPIPLSTLAGGKKSDDGFAAAYVMRYIPEWDKGSEVPKETIPHGTLRRVRYAETSFVDWTPEGFAFSDLAVDCMDIQAALPLHKKQNIKRNDAISLFFCVSLVQRGQRMLKRWKEEGRILEDVEFGGIRWTAESCGALLDRAAAAFPKILSATREYWIKDPFPSSGVHVPTKVSAEAALEKALADAVARADHLERLVKAQEAQLMRLEAATPTAQGPDQIAALRQKVGRLKVLVEEGKAERRALRARLEETERASSAAMPAAKESVDSEGNAGNDDEGFTDTDNAVRGVRLPAFSKQARESFDRCPANVAAGALRLIGELGAGDAAAWRSVKQAKDMPRPLLMARIGIHHRLLFRSEGEELEIIELIPRAALDRSLKRLRAL